MYAPSLYPMHSGRTASGSRTAYGVPLIRSTREYAPTRRRVNSLRARFTSPVCDISFARSRTITSESEVVMNAHPLRESSSRRRPAFTMSPLWPRAMSPYAVEATIGWALSITLEPVVE